MAVPNSLARVPSSQSNVETPQMKQRAAKKKATASSLKHIRVSKWRTKIKIPSPIPRKIGELKQALTQRWKHRHDQEIQESASRWERDDAPPDLFVLVYSTKANSFKLITHSRLILYKVLTRKNTLTIPLPALTRSVVLDFTWDDDPLYLEYVRWRVRLPVWVWVGRNLGLERYGKVVIWRG